MRFHREAGRVLIAPALGLVLAAAITACSGSSSPSSSPSASPSAATSSAAPGSGPSGSATATIKANWQKFFAGSTPTSGRVALLQNGQTFARELGVMESLGTTASAKVSDVKLTSPSQATVTYSIYLGKTAMLPNQKGVAILDNGTWKVSDASVCVLLTLENAGKAPSVCSSAG
ncbi:MAG: hypothetical protein J2P26_00070 [Nocardiopsaceae bacterium]|nr:hypothetical protein [Nocardiopsaceae bacterium]